MTFPLNNLPSQSKFWAREVEKKVTNLENTLRSSDINNTTRDSQLTVTANQALIAASQAQAAADEASAAAAAANTAITGLGNLDEPTSTYKINASNLTAGTINAININGSVITGSTLTTASSGRRVEIQNTNTSYYDEDGNFTGRILGAGTARGSTLELTSGASGELQIWNGGVISYGAGGTFAALSDNGFGVGGNRLYTIGANIEADGNLVATGSMSSSSVSTGGVSCSSVGSSGSISGSSISGSSLGITGDSTLSGRISSVGTYNATISSAANVFIASNGNLARSTSSLRYKTDVQDIDYGMKALDLRPRTWIDKGQYEENGNSAEGLSRVAGFIAEELDELGFTELVVYNDEGQPEAISYDRIAVAIIPVLKQQQALIESLTARIEALETK